MIVRRPRENHLVLVHGVFCLQIHEGIYRCRGRCPALISPHPDYRRSLSHLTTSGGHGFLLCE